MFTLKTIIFILIVVYAILQYRTVNKLYFDHYGE